MRKAAVLSLLAVIMGGCRVPMGTPGTPRATKTVGLSWTASATAGVTYNAYRAAGACAAATNFTKRNTSPITAVTYDDLGVAAGTYCYYVTSYLANATPPESVASNKAEAIVIEQPNPPSNLMVTPQAATVNLGERQQFAMTADGVPVTATWSIIPPDEGSIDASGLYTAPASIKGNNVKVAVRAHHAVHGDAVAEVTLRK